MATNDTMTINAPDYGREICCGKPFAECQCKKTPPTTNGTLPPLGNADPDDVLDFDAEREKAGLTVNTQKTASGKTVTELAEQMGDGLDLEWARKHY